jgi:3-hydroxy-9,10-secoandrosta-1,3,5(10)-triene-9,17-dione monooxygenase
LHQTAPQEERLLSGVGVASFRDNGGRAPRNETPDLETKLRFRAHAAFAVSQLRESVEVLWSCYGAQGLYTRDPLQRHLRDVLAISQHFSFNFDIVGSAYGLVALGGQFASPTM